MHSFDPAQVVPCLTVMISLSRSWSSVDETNFSDLIAEFSRGKRCAWTNGHLVQLQWLLFKMYRTYKHSLPGMLPHKTKRGQAALERLKVFDGIPPPYDKVMNCKQPLSMFCLARLCGFNSAVNDVTNFLTYLVWVLTLKTNHPWDMLSCQCLDVQCPPVSNFGFLFYRGSAWLFQLLLRLCVWSPLARWALNIWWTYINELTWL